MGALNLVVAYQFSEDVWVKFKLFGLMGLTLVFVLAQAPYLRSTWSRAPGQGGDMMLYAIIGTDRPDSLAARHAARPEHLKRLETLQAEGRLVLAGPFPPSTRRILAPRLHRQPDRREFPSLAAATAWAEPTPTSRPACTNRSPCSRSRKSFPLTIKDTR